MSARTSLLLVSTKPTMEVAAVGVWRCQPASLIGRLAMLVSAILSPEAVPWGGAPGKCNSLLCGGLLNESQNFLVNCSLARMKSSIADRPSVVITVITALSREAEAWSREAQLPMCYSNTIETSLYKVDCRTSSRSQLFRQRLWSHLSPSRTTSHNTRISLHVSIPSIVFVRGGGPPEKSLRGTSEPRRLWSHNTTKGSKSGAQQLQRQNAIRQLRSKHRRRWPPPQAARVPLVQTTFLRLGHSHPHQHRDRL